LKAWTGAGFPLAILLALSGLTLWLKHAAELPDERPVDKKRHDPDTIIERMTATALDANGKPLHRISADLALHYPDDDSTDITNPRVHYTPDGQPPILLTAKRGKMLSGKEEVQLHDDVKIERSASRQDPGWVATMPEARAFPATRTASSESPFVFRQGLATVTGTGFALDQPAQTLLLNASVRGQFPPRDRTLK